MQIKFLLLFILCSTVFRLELFAQLDMSKSTLEIEHIDKGIYMLVQNTNISNPSSILYTNKDFSLLIDPGFQQMQPVIKDTITSFNGGPIEYVMATHFHTDHAQALQDYYNVSNILLSSYQYPGAKELKLSRVFSSSQKIYNLHLGDDELEVHTLPVINGHTGSDAVFYFKNSDVLVIGDYLFYEMYPIIDINGGGSIDGYFENLEYIISLATSDTKIIPGHTSFKPEVTKRYYTDDELRSYIDDLKESIKWVQMKKSHQANLSEIIEEGLPEKFQKYNKGMKFVSEEKWITFIYEDH